MLKHDCDACIHFDVSFHFPPCSNCQVVDNAGATTYLNFILDKNVVDASFEIEAKPDPVEAVENRVSILRASGIGGSIPPILVIEAREQIGECESLDAARLLHSKQAESIADALLASLPGGTVDALLAVLMTRRASLFSVPLITPVIP